MPTLHLWSVPGPFVDPLRFCPEGYESITNDLDGAGKKWEQPHPDSKRTMEQCASVCDARQGCTSFEFSYRGSEMGSCGTYTGGQSNVGKDDGRNQMGSKWRSCVKKKEQAKLYVEGGLGDSVGLGRSRIFIWGGSSLDRFITFHFCKYVHGQLGGELLLDFYFGRPFLDFWSSSSV